jgi:hypothetical protein
LAEDNEGAWRMAFEPEERHLFVCYSDREGLPEPADWMSIDDFLTWLPRNEMHNRAIDRLVQLIERAFEQADRY